MIFPAGLLSVRRRLCYNGENGLQPDKKGILQMEDSVILKKDGAVAQIVLNSPGTMNSMTGSLCDALFCAVSDCEKDSAVRVVVLSGCERAFCAGGDLHALEGFTEEAAALDYVRQAGRAAKAIYHSEKPYLAAVEGAAAGAGFNLALACDFVFASTRAKFTQAFSTVGLVSDCGGNFLLPRAVGAMRAKELMMLPRMLSAGEAQALGIVLRVEEPQNLLPAALAFAQELAQRPPRALAGTKRLVNESGLLGFDKTAEAEENLQAMLCTGADAKEGIRAFFEKRAPVFGKEG